jgi:hypothetical protein
VSTQILERPETKDADTGPEMFHYVRKEKIAESAVMGTFVIALCGERFPVTKSPKPGSPVCPQCKEIYEQLKQPDSPDPRGYAGIRLRASERGRFRVPTRL